MSTATSGVDIELIDVVKKFPGQTQPAVTDLSLKIPAGEMVMFVGPSGCGKTTSLKMINRLVEPTSGKILIDNKDVTGTDPTQLRRRVGYVIQGGGLMPHMTVFDNVALVPRLVGWDKQKVESRVNSMLEMVGLEPREYSSRFPRELSGGQQQRVGVARGLAADPPVVLMDEPFGAVDPITRARLQDELISIQSELGKTIVCVTHDMNEAIKLGDRICVFQPGARVAQYDTPEEILAHPADDFVGDFIGADAALQQLRLTRVEDMPMHTPPVAHVGDNAADAVAKAQTPGNDSVVIVDDRDRPREWYSLAALRRMTTISEPTHELQSTVDVRATLSDALSAMLASSHGGALVTRKGVFVGILDYDTVNKHVRKLNGGEGM